MIPMIRRPGWRLQPRTAADDDLASAEALRRSNQKVYRIRRVYLSDPGQQVMPAILLPRSLSRLVPEPDAKGMHTAVRREPFRSRAPPPEIPPAAQVG